MQLDGLCRMNFSLLGSSFHDSHIERQIHLVLSQGSFQFIMVSGPTGVKLCFLMDVVHTRAYKPPVKHEVIVLICPDIPARISILYSA